MDVDSVECLSLPDAAMDAADDVGLATLHPHLAASSRAAACPNPKGGGAGGVVPPGSSVHELLECPVCTNSMYPPIHQVLGSAPNRVLGFLNCATARYVVWV
jgi:hypothetical protein